MTGPLVAVVVSGLLLAPPAAGEGGRLFAPDPVAPITITGAERPLQLTFREGRWWVQVAGKSQLADRDLVRAVIDTLTGMTVERPLDDRGRPIDDAFSSPLRISWGSQQAEIGARSRIPGLVYVRAPDGRFYLMRRPRIEIPADMVDRRIFPDGLSDTREINISGGNRALHAKTNRGTWHLSVPSPSSADDREVNQWLDRLEALKGDPVPEVDASKVFYQIILTDAHGATDSFGLSTDGYVRVGNVVFNTDKVRGRLIPTHFDWVDKAIVRYKEEDITGFEAESGEIRRTFVRKKDKWTDKDSGTIYHQWTQDLFDLLNPLRAESVRVGDPADLGEALMEVRLWQGKKIATSIEFWLDEEGRWWVRGGPTDLLYEIDPDLPLHLTILF
ncbi:MAG: DUF4340 domain-containing protein [Nitrospirota bacterium]|nr:DUF4340 domain-containing protein [Nitrospirota bacterium]